MKKVYLLTVLLAFSSVAFADPCNPDDGDYDPNKCEFINHFFDRFSEPKNERPPVDWDKIIPDPIPEPQDPFHDPRIPRDIPFVPGVGDLLGGV